MGRLFFITPASADISFLYPFFLCMCVCVTFLNIFTITLDWAAGAFKLEEHKGQNVEITIKTFHTNPQRVQAKRGISIAFPRGI